MNNERVKRILEQEKVYAEVDFYSNDSKKAEHFRSSTILKMQWIAERIRKVNRLKKVINEGQYNVSGQAIASSMLNCSKK